MSRFLALSVGLSVLSANAQYWHALDSGFSSPAQVTTIFADEATDRLLIGGTFLSVYNDNDTVLATGIASWNGTRWDSLATRIQEISGNAVAPIGWFVRYQGRLYACGEFSLHTDVEEGNFSLAKLDEENQQWGPLECINPLLSGIMQLVPRITQETLYATGFAGSLCGYPEACVFRYDGQAFHVWEPFEQIPDHTNNYVAYVFDFQGMTYMTGLFRDPLTEGFASFLKWNGAAWEHVPGWGDHSKPIKDIAIRNDTLYVAGAFTLAAGAPGNGIAYFDGTTWNDMGGGVRLVQQPASTTGVSMQWYHDALYLTGQFNEVAGIPLTYALVKWNGRQWCTLPGHLDNPNTTIDMVVDFAVWRDSLYVNGTFNTGEGGPVRHVAQWLGGEATLECSPLLSVNEPERKRTFSIVPNPATTAVILQGLPPTANNVVLRDALGRTVQQQRITSANPTLSLTALGAGLYLLEVWDSDSRLATERLVVE